MDRHLATPHFPQHPPKEGYRTALSAESMAVAAKYLLLGAGAVLVASGVLIRWRMARYDLKDALIDSAWTVARGRRTAENPTVLEAKFSEIYLQPTWKARTAKAIGTIAGHFAAQWLSVVSLILVLVGLTLGLVGLFLG